MRLIAHRGFAGMYPENTLRAIGEATAHADEIEIDVRRCASGELVVFHDESVGRVTDGEGRVDELSLAELRELDVLGTGQGVPTLEEVFRATPPEVGLNLELKEEGLAVDALALAGGVHPQVMVSSFLPPALEEAYRADPKVPRALIVANGSHEVVSAARTYDCTYLHPEQGVVDERLVNEAHRAGMSVNVWTVDSRREAERLDALGVDGVIADRWGVLPTP